MQIKNVRIRSGIKSRLNSTDVYLNSNGSAWYCYCHTNNTNFARIPEYRYYFCSSPAQKVCRFLHIQLLLSFGYAEQCWTWIMQGSAFYHCMGNIDIMACSCILLHEYDIIINMKTAGRLQTQNMDDNYKNETWRTVTYYMQHTHSVCRLNIA